MAITSGLFNSVGGDRKYKADFFAAYFASFIANGVFPNPSTGLQVIANGDMSVSIRSGKAWINGYFMINDADNTGTIEVADGVLNRIDRVVLRLDFSTRSIYPDIKKGSFASTPVAPSLQRDADAYELALADVFIRNGATTITQTNITDQRFNTALCGIVHGVVDQIDTANLFAQYDAEFNDWFATIQDTLSGDVAGNLQNQINELQKHAEDDSIHNVFVKIIKSNKDENGIFATIEHRKKTDNTLLRKSVLSGTSPKYSTRTITHYDKNETVERTEVFTLSYDSDDDLVSEV